MLICTDSLNCRLIFIYHRRDLFMYLPRFAFLKIYNTFCVSVSNGICEFLLRCTHPCDKLGKLYPSNDVNQLLNRWKPSTRWEDFSYTRINTAIFLFQNSQWHSIPKLAQWSSVRMITDFADGQPMTRNGRRSWLRWISDLISLCSLFQK